MTSEESVRELFSKVNAELGTIDVLIHSAATMNLGPVGGVEPSTWWTDFVRSPWGNNLNHLTDYLVGNQRERIISYVSLLRPSSQGRQRYNHRFEQWRRRDNVSVYEFVQHK